MKQFSLFTLIILFSLATSIAQQASIWDQVPEEVRKTNAFKRFEYQYRQIAFPYDTIPMHKYTTELKSEIHKINSQLRKTDSEIVWSPIGPTGVENPSWLSPHWGVSSGRVPSVAVHPTDPLTLYIGAASGGIWKTTNGGNSWGDIGSNESKLLTFGAIAIDPNNPNIIYAGTGELSDYPYHRHYGKGLLKSTDQGLSWFEPTDTFGIITGFGDLVVSPYNSNVVYAALGNGYLFINPNQQNEGVWKSTDGGSSWTRTLERQDAYDIVVHPTDPNIVYAATGGWFTTSGFYISTDAGVTWDTSNTGLQHPSTIGRMQIDIAKSSPNILYAIIYDGLDNTPKAYKTTNGGISWKPISQGVMLSGYGGGSWYDQGGYDLCIAVNPLDPNHVLIGNVELHETTNGSDFLVRRIPGGNDIWESVVHVDYHCLVYAPSDPNVLFIGCDGGIYKSPDNGVSFINLNNGISTIQFYRIASHPANENIIIGGAQDNWTSITFDLTSMNPWVTVSDGDGMECFFDYDYPDSIVYASSQYGRLRKSIDGGNSFSTIANLNGFFITPFFMHPTDHLTLYSANNNILRSTTGGQPVTSWEIIAPNVAPGDVVSMAQSIVNPYNMILVGGGFTNDPVVKVSTDEGFIWIDVTSNIPGESRWIPRVVTHPTDENTMFIIRSGLSENNKIYKTTDLGSSWENISGDLPDLPCWDLFIDPHNIHPNNTNHLYAGMDVGVYRSTDGGDSWQYVSEDIPLLPVWDFDYAEYGTYAKLRVGTYGRSAYETELEILQLPSAPTLIYPIDSTVIDSDSVLFVWQQSQPEVTEYWLELDTTDQFSAPVFSDSTITDTTYLYSALQVNRNYWWKIKAFNFAGWGDFSEVRTFTTNIVSVENEEIPIEYTLEQNYPNPFNPITMIRYSVSGKSNVSLKIFNPLGEEIELLFDETKEAGTYEAVWNAQGLPSGIYFYKMKSGNFVETKKMVLMK
jgi:photosystem II stability/assembly factor-like uncharacterized protein